MQKPSLNVSQKELFTSCVAFARHTCFLCNIVKSFLQIDYTAKSSYVLFYLQYCKATTTANPCAGL